MDQFIKNEILSKLDIILEVLAKIKLILSDLIYPKTEEPKKENIDKGTNDS